MQSFSDVSGMAHGSDAGITASRLELLHGFMSLKVIIENHRNEIIVMKAAVKIF